MLGKSQGCSAEENEQFHRLHLHWFIKNSQDEEHPSDSEVHQGGYTYSANRAAHDPCRLQEDPEHCLRASHLAQGEPLPLMFQQLSHLDD